MREWLLLVLVVISVPFVLRRPLTGMLIYLGATVVRPEMLFWGGREGSYVFKLYYLLILLGMLLNHDFRRAARAMQREFLLMIWLAAAIAVSIMFAEYPVHRDYYYVIELLKGFGICGLLYILVKDEKEVRAVQNVMLGCFAFMGAWGIDQHFRGNDRLEGLGGIAWGDSNGVAAMFNLILPVALAKMYAAENRRQFLAGLAVSAIAVALIICTKSRSGLIGMIVSIAAFAFYSRKSFSIARAAVVLALAAMPFATQEYVERMKTMEGSEGLKSATMDRMAMWKAGLMVFSDNPVVGTGFLTFSDAKMKYKERFSELDDDYRDELFRTQNKKVTHNTYIQLLSDCGLLGAVPFFLLVAGGMTRGMHTRRLLRGSPGNTPDLIWLAGVSAGITGFAVCIFSIDAALTLNLYVQLVLASVLHGAISRSEQEQQVSVAAEDNPLLAGAGAA